MISRYALRNRFAATFIRRDVQNLKLYSGFAHAADQFVLEVPQEREGLNFEFNWSLADDDVTPHGEAFRNLKFARLQEIIGNSPTTGKDAVLKKVDVDLSLSEYQEIFDKVTYHLSLVDHLFAQDAALGSFTNDRTRVRVISDNPIHALYAQALLVRVPSKNVHAPRPIVLYIATQADYEIEKPITYILSDKDDDGNPFVKIVITGTPTFSNIKRALAAAKREFNEQMQSKSIILDADTIIEKGQSILVFNSSALERTRAINASKLYCAHQTIWCSAGLTSLFGGAIADESTLNKKERVQTESGVVTHIPCNNVVDFPCGAVFVDSKASKPRPLSIKDASQLVEKASGPSSAEQFSRMIQECNLKLISAANIDEAVNMLS